MAKCKIELGSTIKIGDNYFKSSVGFEEDYEPNEGNTNALELNDKLAEMCNEKIVTNLIKQLKRLRKSNLVDL